MGTSENLLKSLEPFCMLKKLKVLVLEGCPAVSDKALAHLSQLPLETLILRKCGKISDQGLEQLGKIRSLKVLEFFDYHFKGTDFVHLEKLHNLRVLNLGASNRLTDDAFEHIGKLTNLEELALDYGKEITDAALGHLSAKTKLQVLKLHGCEKITDKGIEDLTSKLGELREISLKGCSQLSEGLIKKLKTKYNVFSS